MKLLITSLFLVLCSLVYSQGNLQFNQVKLVGDNQQTVPTDKVWKIESATLSIKDGIRVPPRFIIGTDTIVLGTDSYTTTNLENVVSVSLDYKGSGCLYPLTGIVLHLDGVGSGSNILSQNLNFPAISATTSNYTYIGTINLPQFSSNNIVSSFFLSLPTSNLFTSVGCGGGALRGSWNHSFRMTFQLSNGNSFVYTSNTSYGLGDCATCCGGCFTSVTGILPTITATSETRSRPYVKTEFPIWVPSGTMVKTLSNIAKLSVLEFNVVP